VDGRPRPLDEIVQEEILLIGREALANAFSHSGAQNIVAEISYQPGALHVRVRDDGRGINEGVLKAGYRSGHWGLPGMRERSNKMRGELRVRSSSEGGLPPREAQRPVAVESLSPQGFAKKRFRGRLKQFRNWCRPNPDLL
jgi:signal transduction histidine kinase